MEQNKSTETASVAPYSLTAEIKATHDDLPAIRQALADLTVETLKEPSCISFEICESSANPGTFFLWEKWKGKAGLEAHYAAPHTTAYFKKEWTDIVSINELTPLVSN